LVEKAIPDPEPANAGERQSPWATPENAAGFSGLPSGPSRGGSLPPGPSGTRFRRGENDQCTIAVGDHRSGRLEPVPTQPRRGGGTSRFLFARETAMTPPAAPILVLGTTNAGKRAELSGLLEPYGISCRSLADFPAAIDVAETGQTFAENAALKASQQARQLGEWVLGEDSGLVVDALDGRPGIYSARFSGPDATAASNNALLLEKLAGVPAAARTAHYACHAALADPTGAIRAASSARCQGTIVETARGTGGFGYDPYFLVAEYHRTFGELAAAVKALISHRGRAIRPLLPTIARLLCNRG